MGADPQVDSTRRYSRRGFLGVLSLSLAAVAGGGMLLKRVFSSGKGDGDTDGEFPGPDSIFHPASDPRRDPRRGS